MNVYSPHFKSGDIISRIDGTRTVKIIEVFEKETHLIGILSNIITELAG